MNTPIGDKLFQDITRRVANFRENRHRDVENLVDETMSGLSELICIMSVGYLTTRENEIELLTTNSIVCILLVLKSFIRNRFAIKSKEFS